MSSTSTPQPSSRGSTPASHLAGPSGLAYSSKSSSKSKPANVFSNDGSFLERFLRTQKDEEEKKRQDEELAKKREFEDRFKKRGKRRPPTDAECTELQDPPAKKTKVDEEKPLTAYEKEMKTYRGSLKDAGTGIRPLVK